MNAGVIKESLKTRDPKSLLKSLRTLQAAFSIKPGEIVPPDDTRLTLAENWLAISPAFQELLDVWAAANTLADGARLVAPVLSVLSCLISLFSFHLPYHRHGISIVKSILSPQWLQQVNSCLSGAQHDQILAAINLFYTMSIFGSGRERKSVFDAFPWDHKTLSKLLRMRRKGKDGGETTLSKPDIRTSSILFILSMFDQNSLSAFKIAFLDQYRGVVMDIFNGLSQDHPALVKKILQASWEDIWLDPKIRRTTKVALFNEVTISHILKLYDRATAELPGDENSDLPADVAHRFLLALCTRHGHGVCFVDHGWYAREANEGDVIRREDADGPVARGGKIYNKILANVLRTLKINEDPRQRELALEVMAACPELVSGYWSMVSVALEPRLSSKWITNIFFVGQVISQAIPISSFFVPGTTLYNPTPPPLSTIMANIFPPAGSKALFTKGLQASSTPIVQHCSALVLTKCLQKLVRVVRTFNTIVTVLEEDQDGLWCCRRNEIEKEVRLRAPEFQVVLAFWQQASVHAENPTMRVLLSESAQRLLSLYQESLPDVVAEAKFEAGRLLNLIEGPTSVIDPDSQMGNLSNGNGETQVVLALQSIMQLHVIRFLHIGGQFTSTGKLASSSHSYLHVLLQAFCSVRIPALRDTLSGLLQKVLSNSLLFQEDQSEVEIWLTALPASDGPGDSPLPSEVKAIISFLDDCVQRFLRTPYRYMEAMTGAEQFASPLLMVTLEQATAKASGGWLIPSDTLSVFVFMRRLLVMLAGKQDDPGYSRLHAILDQLENIPIDPQILSGDPAIEFKVRHELSLARACLYHLREEINHPPGDRADDATVASFSHHQSIGSLADTSFDWLYLQSDEQQLQDQKVHKMLLKAISSRPITFTSLKRSIHLVTHGITKSLSRPKLTAALLGLMSSVFAEARGHLGEEDLWQLKEGLLAQHTLHSLCTSDELAIEVYEVLKGFISMFFDPVDPRSLKILFPVVSYWEEQMNSLLWDQPAKIMFIQPWIKFMPPEKVISIVDLPEINGGQNNPNLCRILEETLGSVAQNISLDLFTSTLSIPRLLKLQCLLPGSSVQQDLLSAALMSRLPFIFDSQLAHWLFYQQPLSIVLSKIPSAAMCNLRSLPTGFISQLLDMETWTSSTARAVIAVLYADSTSGPIYAAWLNSRRWMQLPVHLFTMTLIAFLDLSNGDLMQVNDGVIDDLLKSLFPRTQGSNHADIHVFWVECISKILSLADSRRSQYLRALQETIHNFPIAHFAAEIILLGHKILGIPDCDGLTTSIIDRALEWVVHQSSSDDTNLEGALESLKHIVDHQIVLKSSWMEPLLVLVSQNCLSDSSMVGLAATVAEKAPPKPVVVNRLLRNILQSPDLSAICSDPVHKHHITHLLDILFRLYPADTCQPSHIELLLHVYGGTMSLSDRRLLSIMGLFEAEKLCSISPFLARWSPTADITVTSAFEAVQNFDPIRMLRTCLMFPSWRRFGEVPEEKDDCVDSLVYDPVMVLTLSAQMLVEGPPVTALDWVKVFRSNMVCLLIRCLSSKDPNIRGTAHCQITAIYEGIWKSTMTETSQVIYVFELLKNVLPPVNPGTPPMRLPTYTSLILLHALRGIFHPSNFIYPHTARFLLQRPELDTSDVPMLFGMLYSSSDDWKKERGWILRLLSDGMESTGDWKVLKRRHTWDLVASLFQSSKTDSAVRSGILGMLANLTCNAEACTSLVIKSSILSWIEMQVGDGSNPSTSKEPIVWLRILENIVVVANSSKLGGAITGQWCPIICRIIATILQRKEDQFVTTLHQSAIILLRVSLLLQGAVYEPSLHGVLSHAVECLQYLEGSELVDVHHFRPLKQGVSALPSPPHRAQGLQEMPEIEDSLHTWGNIVEALWRVSMSLTNATPAWNMLTQRLLVWRALVGDDLCPMGEWARKEVVRIERTNI